MTAASTAKVGWPVGVDPVLLVLGLGLTATAAWALGLSQDAVARAVVGLFAVAVVLSPANGLVLLFLLPPLFNGESQRPYFVLLEFLVYGTLVAGAVIHLARRRWPVFPRAGWLLLFLVSTAISFPLNARELWLEAQVSSWRDLVEDVARSDLEGNLAYVRAVLNVLSGVGLYVLVVNERWPRERLVRLAAAATLAHAIVTVAGLWLYMFPPASGTAFLSLWLGGETPGGFAGLGFNTSYFGQYAIAYLPFAGLVLIDRTTAWLKGVAAIAFLLTGLAVVLTYQRGAYAVLILELILLLAVTVTVGRSPGRSRPPWIMAATVALLAVLVAGVLLATPIGGRVAARIATLWHHGDSARTHLSSIAWQMFRQEPLLGVGTGRFAHFYHLVTPTPTVGVGSLSSHSVSLQLLAEQGALGLLSFLAVLAATVGGVMTRARRPARPEPPLLFLLVSLTAWLVYGSLQYTFLIRSMQVYFWIVVGLIVSLTPASARIITLPRRLVTAGLVVLLVVVLLVVVGFRAREVLTRPLPPGYTWGIHAGAAKEARWTRGGAVFTLPVEGRLLRLGFSCPIPQVAHRPQRVAVLVDGKPVGRLSLDTPRAKALEVPVEKSIGSTILVQIKVRYTFVPSALGINPDTRRLGVLMQPVGWSQ